MTHLSDFSYLQRCTIWVYMSAYLVYCIYQGDKFRCLRWRSIVAGELKSIITILLILEIIMQFMYDIVSTYVKYEEGFVDINNTIITKPFSMWTSSHQRNTMAMDYVECVTFSMQVGIFFLMQSFWNYLSNSVAKKSFMGSFEFKFYIFWALACMALFPVLQWVYRDDVFKREGIPQLAYGIAAFIASLLGIRSHFRFKKIIALSTRNKGASNRAIVTRLSYFKDMNVLASIILFCYAASFIVICSDGLTEAKVINSSKFATDVIIANVNICTVFLNLLLMSIFHPRSQYTKSLDDTSTTNNESNFRYSNNNRVQQGNNYIVDESPRSITDMQSEKKFAGSNINTHNLSNNNNNGFMRAMSPVTVDYPHINDTMPLTSSVGTGRPLSPPENQSSYQQKQQRSVAIEDPYNNEPVMFTMMDPTKQQRFGSPSSPRQHDIPMRGMNNMSPQQRRYEDEYKYTQQPQQIRRPSWENESRLQQPVSPKQQHLPGQPGEQMVRDWLWQSPDRRT